MQRGRKGAKNIELERIKRKKRCRTNDLVEAICNKRMRKKDTDDDDSGCRLI